jgi:plasmid stabilization system protein ParE
MALQIIWTENALEDFNNIVDYLLKNWPLTVAENFIYTVQKRITNLSSNPSTGIVSRKFAGVRSIVLTKHNKLYYLFTEEKLTILNIFDNRQDPVKNKFD